MCPFWRIISHYRVRGPNLGLSQAMVKLHNVVLCCLGYAALSSCFSLGWGVVPPLTFVGAREIEKDVCISFYAAHVITLDHPYLKPKNSPALVGPRKLHFAQLSVSHSGRSDAPMKPGKQRERRQLPSRTVAFPADGIPRHII